MMPYSGYSVQESQTSASEFWISAPKKSASLQFNTSLQNVSIDFYEALLDSHGRKINAPIARVRARVRACVRVLTKISYNDIYHDIAHFL